MDEQEILYTIALTRIAGIGFRTALQLYRELGSGRAVYAHRQHIADVLPHSPDRQAQALGDWESALGRAEQELAFMMQHRIQPLCLADEAYPQRLAQCPDAPIILFYRGSAALNRRRIVSIVGTRHATQYGQDLIRRFVRELKELCPEVLIVSGLAYGVDICAHREALACGLDTLGVLAHGLDELYPSLHRDTAKRMLEQGGLLTEYTSQTRADKLNFVRRNRIVAGISDATILVESATKGGGLITCGIAMDYDRAVFAFPGAVGMPYSEGCNRLIRDNGAALITSAEDFVTAMNWQQDSRLRKARNNGIERQLFPDLSAEEQMAVEQLAKAGDLQLNQLAVRTNIPVGRLTALLFQLEMKGVVKPLAGGTYHLLK